MKGIYRVLAKLLSGKTAPSMTGFDRIITDLMGKWGIPGGAVALAKNGRLVLAQGYGLADVERQEPVRPDSLFRIASVSKPITAVAIFKLAEEKQLDLEASAFHILDRPALPGITVNSKIYDITIRQLLLHSGGWDSSQGFDPMFISDTAASEVGAPEPTTSETIIRFMMGQPLDFDPGTRYAYSNFGYCVLGRVIEKVTGQTYSDYIRNQLLRPIGIRQMRIGGSLLEHRAEGEVRYYDYAGAPLVQSVFPNVGGPVPWPYGGFHLEAMDAHGGWIASAIDLVRFITALDGSRPPAILKPESVSLMVSRPAPPLWVEGEYYHGMGWLVRPMGGGTNWWYGGLLPGTTAILVRTYHGLAWAALFNSRPEDWLRFHEELDFALWQAVSEVAQWPGHDLFG